MTTEKLAFLTSFLKVVIEKLKWDPDTSPDDLEQDERAAFESMRKVCRKYGFGQRAPNSQRFRIYGNSSTRYWCWMWTSLPKHCRIMRITY